MESSLVQWSEIRREIETAKDWDTLESLTDKVKAFQIWSKQTKQSLETQNKIAEYRLRLERTKGAWLDENVPHGGDRGNQHTGGKVDEVDLATLGVSKHESTTARKIASIPEETFEEFIAEKTQIINQATEELTVKGVVKLADSLNNKESMSRTKDIGQKMEIEKRANELIKEINTMPVLFRMKIKQAIK